MSPMMIIKNVNSTLLKTAMFLPGLSIDPVLLADFQGDVLVVGSTINNCTVSRLPNIYTIDILEASQSTAVLEDIRIRLALHSRWSAGGLKEYVLQDKHKLFLHKSGSIMSDHTLMPMASLDMALRQLNSLISMQGFRGPIVLDHNIPFINVGCTVLSIGDVIKIQAAFKEL